MVGANRAYMPVLQDPRRIGQRLKAARERAGLTQAEVAGSIGVDTVTVSRWENGRQAIKAERLMYLANLYGTTAGEVLGEHAGNPLDELVVERLDSQDYTPNPALAHSVPAAAYDLVIARMRQLVAAGVPVEEVESYELIILDPRWGPRRRGALGRELNENDWHDRIEGIWMAIREGLERRGIYL